MKRYVLWLLAIGLTTLPANAQANVLFERTLIVNRSTNIFDATQFDLDLTFADAFVNPTNPVTLFDSLVISTSDVGTTFDATSGTDASFLAVAGRITDNQDETIRLLFTEDQPGGSSDQQGLSESSFFLNGTPPTSPDLTGTIVDQISLRVDQFTLLPEGEGDLSNPGVDLLLTFTAHGIVIPEPATGWLLLAGLAVLGTTTYWRRTKASHL